MPRVGRAGAVLSPQSVGKQPQSAEKQPQSAGGTAGAGGKGGVGGQWGRCHGGNNRKGWAILYYCLYAIE